MLALPEFILTGAHIDERDELVAEVELPRNVQACPHCGVIELHRLHDYRRHSVRHLPVAGRACRLRWRKRLLACVEGCGTFVERTPSIAPGAVWTRAAARAAVGMSADNVPVERIRRAFGVGWNTVMRAVDAAAALVAAIRPTRVGIDETVMTTGRLTTRRREFVTALVCLDTALVVAVRQGRDRAVAARLLADHAPDAQVVTCDLFSGYKSAADTLADATVVADVFHLVRLGLQALDEVRRRRQQQLHGHRGHKHDPLFRLRRVLRVAQERLDPATRASIYARLRTVDTDDEVASAWYAIDLLRRIYQAPDRDTAHRRLVTFYDHHRHLAEPSARVLRQPRHQRRHRERQRQDQRRAPRGPRVPQPPQLPRIMLHAGQSHKFPTIPRIRSYTLTTAA